MELKPIKTRKIYEEIAEQLRKLVAGGKLKPGDRLPSERELAERLQVSRASVREALSALEMMGLVEVRSGEGTYVRHVNMDSVVAPLAWVLALEKDTVEQLMEVRKILETQAVRLAAERAEEPEIREMSEALEIMRQDLETGELGEVADHRFHFAVTQATHNQILVRIMNSISDTMHQTLKISRRKMFSSKSMLEKLYHEHAGILEAVRERDAAKASQRMLDHLIGVENETLKDL
ncbi:FadR/GntR family transcriptional regulator [Acididesulfobacillus acetoxydans]|uniref:FadR/GntR family transcriptional regulator n=1 Tax=Acididesulfobacillus acetoxydans TaxID=1561005 RepID=UPI001F111EC1|nr:FadR/GntR family transcriptional regulator [Acididesulfobacillus acetoxydans]